MAPRIRNLTVWKCISAAHARAAVENALVKRVNQKRSVNIWR